MAQAQAPLRRNCGIDAGDIEGQLKEIQFIGVTHTASVRTIAYSRNGHMHTFRNSGDIL